MREDDGTLGHMASTLDIRPDVASGLDDATSAYIAEAQEAFGLLCQVISQMAGLLVLDAAGARSAAMEHPMIERAEVHFGEAEERVAGLTPSPRAAHHHHHLMQVIEAVRLALFAMQRRRLLRADRNDPLAMLRKAWDEIDSASRALPGFEPIDLSQSCCATHMRLRGRSVVTPS